jgi:hypothetical protein
MKVKQDLKMKSIFSKDKYVNAHRSIESINNISFFLIASKKDNGTVFLLL